MVMFVFTRHPFTEPLPISRYPSYFIVFQVSEHTISLIFLLAPLRKDKTTINHTCCSTILTLTRRNPDVSTPIKASAFFPQMTLLKEMHPVSTSTGSVVPPAPIVTSIVYTMALFWLITPVKLADESEG